ncbi:PAS domain S-box protein [Haloferax larsenii]|uniref:histidine kinase n=1 Tax=Haloferax larsenii TaxID=302484 RepID=A0ABY5RCV8_HALLR|nr:ATP-binding protein [Haloferax larsenii]UVE49693.1 PAS domain S-box protein [Haloferax larsenii]
MPSETPHILLVGESQVAEPLVTAFETAGDDCNGETVSLTVTDGIGAALSRLRGDGPFDCVVVAEWPEDGVGVELVREIRATDSGLPIVYLADNTIPDRTVPDRTTELVELGIEGYLQQGSFDPNIELVPRVERLATRHRAERLAEAATEDGSGYPDDDWLLEDALDALDDVFYVYDSTGSLVRWNARLNELFGLSDEELYGKNADSFFDERDRPAIRRAFNDVLEGEEKVVEARANTKEGPILFQLSNRRLVAQDGSIVGVCGVARDVTLHRHHEEQLARQNERLDEFARVLSHDLRNPLSISMGFLELEREANDSEYLGRVADSLERIRDIVDDVLHVARQGTAVLDIDTVSLESVARDAWSTVDTNGSTLVVEADATIEADRERLQRLFENLFRNSIEHAGPSPTVTVGLLDSNAGFAVGDDGDGINPNVDGNVFEPGVTTNPDGTGFGLDIVRSLADAHGWSVENASGDAKGARFEFTGVTFCQSAADDTDSTGENE